MRTISNRENGNVQQTSDEEKEVRLKQNEDAFLSLTDAWELAISRGCRLSRNSFRQWFTNHKGKIFYGISKHSSRGKYLSVN